MVVKNQWLPMAPSRASEHFANHRENLREGRCSFSRATNARGLRRSWMKRFWTLACFTFFNVGRVGKLDERVATMQELEDVEDGTCRWLISTTPHLYRIGLAPFSVFTAYVLQHAKRCMMHRTR